MTVLILFSVVAAILYKNLKRKKDSKADKIPDDIKQTAVNSDIYLTKSILSSDLIEYKFTNKYNADICRAECYLSQGKINVIKLYSEAANQEASLQAVKDTACRDYLIKDMDAIAGKIVCTDNGLKFKGLDNTLGYQAIVETKTDDGLGVVADLLLSLEFSAVSSSSSVKYVILTDENNELLGKYYIHLKNIELADTSNKFARQIAVIFAMLIDSRVIEGC
jgi:hypothetical protein